MNNDNGYQEINELLSRHNQEHLLDYYDQLTDPQKRKLLDAISQLDFSVIPGWIESYVRTNGTLDIPEHFDPAPYYPAQPSSPEQQRQYEQAMQLGTEAISSGKVAGFV